MLLPVLMTRNFLVSKNVGEENMTVFPMNISTQIYIQPWEMTRNSKVWSC